MPEITVEELRSMDVLQRLNACMDQMTKSQRIVASYLQEHTMEAAFSTVDKTAHTIGVSTTTVVRLAITLGYSGYAEMQSALKNYLTTMSAPIHMFSTVNQSEAGHERPEDFSSLMELEIQNLRDTCAALSKDTVEQAVDAIANARNVFVLGGRSCEGPARFLAYNLDRMFLNTQYVMSDLNHVPELINRMTNEDVVIYFGFSRYLRAIGDVARFARNKGAKVVGITDSATAPWIPFTDYVFICANQSANFYHSPLAAIFISNVIMKQCAKKDSARVEESLQKLEQTAQALQMFVKP